LRVLVKTPDGKTVADLKFDRQKVYIGSQAGCGVRLPDARVASQQAMLKPEPGNIWAVENLAPELSTTLNGEPLTRSRRVHNGDELGVFDFVLKLYLEIETQVADIERRARRESVDDVRKHKLPAGAKVKKFHDAITITVTHMRSVSAFGRQLLGCATIRDMMDETLSALLDLFGARCVWIGLRREPSGELEFVEGRRANGEPCEPPALCTQLVYRCLDRAQHVCVPRTSEDNIGSALAVPLITADGNLGVFFVDRGKRAEPYGLEQLDLIAAIAAQAAGQLESILHNLERRQAELGVTAISIAHEIQAGLQPKSMPAWDTMQLAAYSRPGDSACGDFYDFVKLPDERGAVFVAHGDGPGAQPAAVAAQLRAAFRLSVLRGNSPHSVLRQINWLLSSRSNAEHVKGWAMEFDPKTGEVNYSHGGELGALVIDTDGEPKPLIETPLPELGQKPNVHYESTTVTLAVGATIALFTPGVTQITNAVGEPFGGERFIESLCDGFGQPAGKMLALARSDVEAFGKDGRNDHDMSIILLHRNA
jgi:serine phosphatase RsbU (regulator of sigma subunit)